MSHIPLECPALVIPTDLQLHILFDLAAWISAGLLARFPYVWRLLCITLLGGGCTLLWIGALSSMGGVGGGDMYGAMPLICCRW